MLKLLAHNDKLSQRVVLCENGGFMKNENGKNGKLQKIGYVVFTLMTLVVILVIGLLDKSKVSLQDAILSMDLFYIFLAVICLAVFWLLEGFTIKYATVSMDKEISYWRSYRVGIIGQLYSALTPSSSGGQPAQILFMKKGGIPVGTATSVTVVKFIAFQSSLCLLFIISILYKFVFFMDIFAGQIPFVAIGFIVNIIGLTFAITAMFRKQWITNTACRILDFLHKIKILKAVDKVKHSWFAVIDEFHSGMVAMRRIKSRIWKLCLVVCIQLLFQFAITYFIYRACGLSTYNAIDIISLQIILYLAISYIPLPGASIAAEGGFMLVFGGIFGTWAFAGMVIWRALTYYAQILFGGVIVVIENVISNRQNKMVSGRKVS